MIKRVFATGLWFVAAWMVVSALDLVVALPFWVAPIVATAAAALIAVDPRHILWSQKDRTFSGRAPNLTQAISPREVTDQRSARLRHCRPSL